MFGALGRLFRAFWYLITGRIDRARKVLSKNPDVVRATFDKVIAEKKKRIQTYKEAVATLIAQEEKKVQTVKALTGEIEKLERLKAGAAAKAKSRVEALKAEGKSMDEIKTDEDYKRCLSAFQDFSTTLAEKQKRIEEDEGDVEQYQKTIGDHKVQLEALMREIDELKREAADTVADMVSAQEEKAVADMLTGISEDTSAKELSDLRDLRQEMKANARVSRELAGVDAKRSEDEFLQYAMQDTAADEFDALIGLAKEADAPAATTETEQKTTLPES